MSRNPFTVDKSNIQSTDNNLSSVTSSTTDSQSSKEVLRIAIIGAGLSGLMSADLIEQAFASGNQKIQIDIYEKSAGVGRMATRYQMPQKNKLDNSDNQWQFDFGAAFFTAKTPEFQSYIKPWVDQKVIEPWRATTASVDFKQSRQIGYKSGMSPTVLISSTWGKESYPRYISSPKMTTWGRKIASQLAHSSIHYKTRVAPLTSKESVKQATRLYDEQHNLLGEFDWVISTAPQVQAYELMQNSGFKHISAINDYKMLACYSLMLGWHDESNLPISVRDANWSVLYINDPHNPTITRDVPFAYPSTDFHETISCLGRLFIEYHKPQREQVLPSITIHANNIWSQVQVDGEPNMVKAELLTAAKKLLNWDESTAPDYIDCHRWRYASLDNFNGKHEDLERSRSNSKPFLYLDTQSQWIVTGDWCAEGRIESCFEVASQVAKTIYERSIHKV